jgi:hypothetical protein
MYLDQLLPESLLGWKTEKSILLRNSSDLYNYMDGGAELYLSYGFTEAISRTFTITGQQEVLVELFDLTEARNAFGVFTQTREEQIEKFGQGTYAITGAVFFWKGRYYVSVSSWEPTPESITFINSLAAFIDENITETGEIPDLVNVLPQEDLIPAGFKYFHHYVWLNAYFFISDQNFLLIDSSTDAVIARYTDGDNRKYLLLVQYSDQQSAQKAYSALAHEFFPEGLTNNCIRLEDNTYLAATVSGKMVAAIFNAGSQQSANQLLNRVLEKYKKN